ncbi:MAG: diguanylate cyclase [Gammaproteobacteria bacterium]|nr:diguanylate cyclase [Gammaproteobacteria bacterium]MBU3988888.1 diguanylate cyclase [Gammaproteobacteria bacterium]MBU4003790.1 diguanylate cyclase [Gammaproteobacteria bacterium]MBU4021668.1 diguanylate cyclase [Gammaproteobacteria bacterium]MBU4094890.1 diguanylate cyclase [Gammaproteobacteria bacterium]
MFVQPVQAADDREPLTFGVFAFLGEERTRAMYQPVADYLNQTLKHERIVLKVLAAGELENALTGGELDIVTTNPTHFMVIRKQIPLTGVIATLVGSEAGQPQHMLAGAIIARADRNDIRTLQDVRGKVVAAPSLSHMGGYRSQAYELFQAGVRLPEQVARLDILGEHQAVVQAVLAGSADVGFVRSGIVEMMGREGSLPAGKVKLIHPQHHPAFLYQVSTRLYPEWPVFAMPHVKEHSVRHVAAALYALEPDNPAARAAGIHGYTVPADYQSVDELSRALRLPPYDRAPEFTIRDAWEKWRLFLILGLATGLLVIALSAALMLALRRARFEQSRSHGLLLSLGEGVYGCDQQGRCIFINPAALRMLGRNEEEVIGQKQHLLFHHHRPDGEVYPEAECPVHLTLDDGQVRRGEEWFFRADGSGFPVDLVVTPLHEDKQRSGAIAAFRDITRRKAMDEKLLHLATTDTLTGLANRRHFLAQVEQEADRIRRFGNLAALLMLDLDHFKSVNDQHGHAAGDAVLKAFAQTVQASLRKTDRAGRMGGEEFAILLPETTPEAARNFAERLRQTVAALPIDFENRSLSVTVSIGVTSLSPADIAPEDALRRADQAMYQAKESGRNRVELLLPEQPG